MLSANAQTVAAVGQLPPVTVMPPEAPPPKRIKPSPRRAQSARNAPAVQTAPPVVPVTSGTTSGAATAGPGYLQPTAASEVRISGEQLNARPASRVGEVLEAVPGLIASQHSGEGKANQ
ncbi:MAG: TonB-dependent receptor, partial [Bradyrhizobium sp.]|nr:TonB-dependent receptor [Bradyrhizobium sp.]